MIWQNNLFQHQTFHSEDPCHTFAAARVWWRVPFNCDRLQDAAETRLPR